ncbi:DUF1999 domain-containing protein [Deinococcus sp. HMF7620]|uniref:DUF1999 domain-containing protein n=1 Tax=Deinococcus arboris TaxID=2682977 RepID=A0A7C9LS19_9DEIO|nr:DUF1999 domain-containing protein [Deinococcus arboris]MVN87801.1 DUF1999 domain-containing protein [Deinococcus arboris]
MRYRTFGEQDYVSLQALDLLAQRTADPAFDTLPAREQEGRLHTSLPALKFYERSEHSFVAEEDGQLHGVVLAQSVWQGDRPTVLVRTLTTRPGAAPEVAASLLHATVKSAYDAAVYEVHFALTPDLAGAALQEEAVVTGCYAVCHLGTRAQTAPGVRLGTPGVGDA